MQFRFVGNIGTKLKNDRSFYIKDTTKKGKTYNRINFYVDSARNNRAYVELFGMKDTIKTKDNDNNDLNVEFEDRFDEDIVSSINRNRKYLISTETERNEYIAPYDVCEFFKENVDEFTDGTYVVSGATSPNVYNGKVTDRYQIRNIYPANENERKGLTVSGEFFYTADSFDLDSWKEEKKIYINGWIREWIDKDTGAKYIPKQVVFDCSKVDFDNENQVKLVNFNLFQLGVEFKDGKIKNKLKGKKVYSQFVICSYVNGAEEVPFNEDELTDNQKMAIKLGKKTLDDFRPSGSIYGNRVTLLKLVDFSMKGKWEDGYSELDMTLDEFEDDILVLSDEEKLPFDLPDEEEKPKKKESKVEEEPEEISVDDLFG